MAMSKNEIEAMIREALPDARVEVNDLAGDGEHYSATRRQPRFQGQEPGAAAPDGLCGAERPDGRDFARARASDFGGIVFFVLERSSANFRRLSKYWSPSICARIFFPIVFFSEGVPSVLTF